MGWAVGSRGTILATANGGATWAAQSSGTQNSLLAVHFTDAQRGWAVGDSGTILATANGGATWAAQSSGTQNSLWAVHFTDAQRGWAVGDSGTILITAPVGFLPFSIGGSTSAAIDKLQDVLARSPLLPSDRNKYARVLGRHLGEAAGLDAQLTDGRGRTEDGQETKPTPDTKQSQADLTRNAVLERIRKSAEDPKAGPKQWAGKDGVPLLKQLATTGSRDGSPFEDRAFITLQATRISIIFIIFFAVQFLVGIYRYNTRLSAFYVARADALLMMDRPAVAVELAAGLTPDDVDFTKGPQTPISAIKDTLLAATRLPGRGSGRTGG